MKYNDKHCHSLVFSDKERLKLIEKHHITYNKFEELLSLLDEFSIKDLNTYLKENSYLFKADIYYLAKKISNTFNKEQDYKRTINILTKAKYGIIKKKRGI